MPDKINPNPDLAKQILQRATSIGPQRPILLGDERVPEDLGQSNPIREFLQTIGDPFMAETGAGVPALSPEMIGRLVEVGKKKLSPAAAALVEHLWNFKPSPVVPEKILENSKVTGTLIPHRTPISAEAGGVVTEPFFTERPQALIDKYVNQRNVLSVVDDTSAINKVDPNKWHRSVIARSKLTPESVLRAREMSKNGATAKEIAAELGVAPETAKDIIKGYSWAWVK